jgi:hypothetical protein
LHEAEAPDHHERHPHAKIQAQKLIDKAPVRKAATPNTAPLDIMVEREAIGAII